MLSFWPVWLKLVVSALVAFLVAYFLTPVAKMFAIKIGAIDVPKDNRRVHDHPIPLMGGLAIFLGFTVAVICFVSFSKEVAGIMLGSVIIVAMGIVDDKYNLNPWLKLAIQVLAALVAVAFGVSVDAMTFPINGVATTVKLGFFAVPITVIWIVGCTNAVNLIDGLDGLAVGVSAISGITMFAVAFLVSEPDVALMLLVLSFACFGFMPYNLNPAEIFMGDTGSQFLGYILATVSIMGLFKFYAVFSFIVPFLALAVPLADTLFAFVRRISKGQSPFKADKKHFHHRLLAMGLNQRQAVGVLYAISAVCGLIAIGLAAGIVKVSIACVVLAVIIIAITWLLITKGGKK